MAEGRNGRPPSRSHDSGMSRPGSSPRIQLQPLLPPKTQGHAAISEGDKEYTSSLKKDIRHIASKLGEYANALEVDKRMADSSSLLRRPLTPGSLNGARPPSSQGASGPGSISANIESMIEKACSSGTSEANKIALLELLFTVIEEAQRCTIALTDKKAPSKVQVPPCNNSSPGRADTRREVASALMDRALALHGAIEGAKNVDVGGQHAPGSGGAAELGAQLCSVIDKMLELSRVQGGLVTHLDKALKGSLEAIKGRPEADSQTIALNDASQAVHSDLVSAVSQAVDQASRILETQGASGVLPLRASAATLKAEALEMARTLEAARRRAHELEPLVKGLSARVVAAEEGESKRKKEDVEKELQQAKQQLKSLKNEQEDEASVVQDVMNAAKIQALAEDNRQLKAENDRLKAAAVKIDLTPALPSGGGAPEGDLKAQIIVLRGDLGLARSNLEKERSEVIALESRLRAERDKADDLQKDVERRDETIAHLSAQLQSHERLQDAQGKDADTFEAVLAEEMAEMRAAYEQKLSTLKGQLEREQITFSRERKESREAYDKEIRALHRRVDILMSKAGHLIDPRELMTPTPTPR